MPKDNRFYFSHDHNARNDRKIALLVKEYRAAGYGIFWSTVEMLHEEGGELGFDEITFNAIAKDLNETPEFIEAVLQACLSKYGLLHCASNVLRSNRVKKNLSEMKQNTNKKKEAGRLGGINSGKSRRNENKTKQNEAVLQADEPHLEANEPNEMKRKDIKEEIINNSEGVPPPKPPDFNLPLSHFYRADDFNGLPQSKIDDFIRLVDVVKKVKISKEDVEAIWEIFKNQNLTGEKAYESESAVYRHFINTHKNFSFKKESKPRERKSKNEKIIGVEFINDFTQCKMIDDSVMDLSTNQRDGAKYNQINPSSIVKK